MSIKANLVIDQGADFSTTIYVADTENDVVDLTGYTANASFKKTPSSSNTVTFTTSINAAAGAIVLELSANVSANVIAGRYVYDVLLTDTVGKKSRIVEGIVTVTPRITT